MADQTLLIIAYFVLRFWQVSDQKPLSTWTVKQGQTFSCPAIYNSQTKEYVAISDSKVRQTKVSGPTTVVMVTTNIFCNLQSCIFGFMFRSSEYGRKKTCF